MQDTMRNIGLHAPGRRHTRRDAPRAALLLASLAALLVFSGTAAAQASWRIDNISPVRSDRDGGDPNSASGGRVNQLAAHPTNNQIYFAASEWGGLFRTGDGGRNWAYVQGYRAQSTWDVEFNPGNANVLVATSRFDGKSTPQSGVNVSRDGGTTWAVPFAVAVLPPMSAMSTCTGNVPGLR